FHVTGVQTCALPILLAIGLVIPVYQNTGPCGTYCPGSIVNFYFLANKRSNGIGEYVGPVKVVVPRPYDRCLNTIGSKDFHTINKGKGDTLQCRPAQMGLVMVVQVDIADLGA